MFLPLHDEFVSKEVIPLFLCFFASSRDAVRSLSSMSIKYLRQF